MADRKVRWAVIRSGGIGWRTVGDLRPCEDAEVVAIGPRARATADAFARAQGLLPAFDDFASLCASPEVDAVCIGTPHATHFALARQALQAGKHVLCEKPLTMTAGEARVLGRVAAEHRVFLMAAMWMKFSPALCKAVELVESGVVGNLADVTATGAMRPGGVDLDEAITLRHASGAIAQLAMSITCLVPPRGWLAGRKGSIDFHPLHPVSATAEVLAFMQRIQAELARERDARARRWTAAVDAAAPRLQVRPAARRPCAPARAAAARAATRGPGPACGTRARCRRCSFAGIGRGGVRHSTGSAGAGSAARCMRSRHRRRAGSCARSPRPTCRRCTPGCRR